MTLYGNAALLLFYILLLAYQYLKREINFILILNDVWNLNH
jgi:hypothetical protein